MQQQRRQFAAACMHSCLFLFELFNAFRFGEVVSCDIIRDSRTGQSLQYAFVGFKKKEECEAAYFKMQNVLVDDRRSVYTPSLIIHS